MGISICEHIKPGGQRCGSPAQHNEKKCFYHARVRKLVPKTNLFSLGMKLNRPDDPYKDFEFPDLEDAAAIQIGFMQLIHGVAEQRFDRWRAHAILSALHGAAANLRHLDQAMASCEKQDGERKSPARVEGAELASRAG